MYVCTAAVTGGLLLRCSGRMLLLSLCTMHTFFVQLAHHFTNARQAAQVEGAILLVDETAGANFDHLRIIKIKFML
jgi:hypothetical protein